MQDITSVLLLLFRFDAYEIIYKTTGPTAANRTHPRNTTNECAALRGIEIDDFTSNLTQVQQLGHTDKM